MVVSWPAKIKDKGGLRTQFHHVIDVAPTLLEIAFGPAGASIDGYEVPLEEWFRESSGMGRLLDEFAAEAKTGDLIGKDRLKELISEHKTGRADHSEILWTCLNFWLWKNTFSLD